MKKHNYQRLVFHEFLKEIHTSVPGYVLAFDPAKQRAMVQPAIDRVDVNGWSERLPAIIDVPVKFAGGGGFHIEHQIAPGDEGLIKFSERCVDMWKQTGGTVRNTDGRICNLMDAFFEPGYRSNPNVIAGFSNDGVKIRDKSGVHYFWLKSDGTTEITNGSGTITMLADGTVNINGAIINPDGTIVAPNVTFGGVSGVGHRHSGVESGPDTSGGPV